MAKAKLSKDEKFTDVDFDLFKALNAQDKKDYNYYDTLTAEQQRKFVPYMMLIWMSAVQGSKEVQDYYLRSTEYHANKYFFDENVVKNPKLQWLMLCAASPGVGKQYHKYIPHLREKLARLKDMASEKEIFEYYQKLYPKENEAVLAEITEKFCDENKRKFYFASKFPNLKLDEIEVLSKIVTDEEILQYEQDHGNI